MEHMHYPSPQQASGSMYPTQAPGMGQGAMPRQQAMADPMYAPHVQQQSSLFGFANERFFKGLLIGAAAAYLLTNENVQRTAIKGAVKAWGLLQGGVEELKERFHDAEAEIRAEKAE